MSNCKIAPIPVITGLKLSKDDEGSTVGILMYLTVTRPGIMHGVSIISRFMESPKDSHWKEGKRIMRHVSGKKDLCIMYSTSENFKLIRYTDSDNGGSTNNKKNTYWYTFHFGTGVVSWVSKKRPIVTLPSAEAEYVAATSAACNPFGCSKF